MSNMNSKQAAAEIRKALKSAGIKASVRIDGINAVEVYVIKGSVTDARKLAEAFKRIDTDDQGNILGGGNLFVNVRPAPALIEEKRQLAGVELAAAFMQLQQKHGDLRLVPSFLKCRIEGKSVEMIKLEPGANYSALFNGGQTQAFVTDNNGHAVRPSVIDTFHTAAAALEWIAWVLADCS